jgi:iron complex transport system permease protein
LKKYQLYIFLCLGVVITFVLGLLFGTSSMTVTDSLKALLAGVGVSTAKSTEITIVYSIRLPGVLVAMLSGSALGFAGWLSQTLFRNNLADPYIAGIGSGAVFGVNLTLLLGLQISLLGLSAISISAFVGALISCFIIWAVAGKTGSTSTSLVLAGIALSFVFGGVNHLIVMYGRDILSRVVFWSWNGLSSAGFNSVILLIVVMIICVLALPLIFNNIDAYILGDEQSTYLGVDPKKTRRVLFLLVSLLTGTSVATAGLLGFVGLIIPHMSRKLLGADSRSMLPGTILLGSIVLGLAYTVGRAIIPHQQIPASVIMSILGGAFFMWLVVRRPTW